MKICPNCQQPVPEGRGVCPNCGADVSAVWPPAPTVRPPDATPPKGGTSTQQANGLGIGCLLSSILYFFLAPMVIMAGEMQSHPLFLRYGAWTINLLPLALVGLLYFVLRPKHPRFARGLGYCLIVIGVLLLYGLAVCRR